MTATATLALAAPAITDKKFHVWKWIPVPGSVGATICVGSAAPGTCDGCGKIE